MVFFFFHFRFEKWATFTNFVQCVLNRKCMKLHSTQQSNDSLNHFKSFNFQFQWNVVDYIIVNGEKVVFVNLQMKMNQRKPVTGGPIQISRILRNWLKKLVHTLGIIHGINSPDSFQHKLLTTWDTGHGTRNGAALWNWCVDSCSRCEWMKPFSGVLCFYVH